MVEINLYLLLSINIIVTIVVTIGTSYLKELGKNVAIKQMKGKITEIDENIKKQIESESKIKDEQKTLLVNFFTECDNLIFKTLKLHNSLHYHIYDKNLISQIDSQVTKLNTSISSMSLFLEDEDIKNIAIDYKDSLLDLSSFRKHSILEINFIEDLKEDKMKSLSLFHSQVIDKDSEASKKYKNSLSSEISELANRKRLLYDETPEKLKDLYEEVKQKKANFESLVRKKILNYK